MVIVPSRLGVEDVLKTDAETKEKVELILETSNRKKELAKAYHYTKFWNWMHAKALQTIKEKGFTVEQMEALLPNSWQKIMKGQGIVEDGR